MSTAMIAARRNLVWRIERFLDGLDHEGRAPTLWENWCIEDGLLLLESHSYPGGEQAMMWAEKVDVFGTPKALALIASTAEARPVTELLERLAKIKADQA